MMITKMDFVNYCINTSEFFKNAFSDYETRRKKCLSFGEMKQRVKDEKLFGYLFSFMGFESPSFFEATKRKRKKPENVSQTKPKATITYTIVHAKTTTMTKNLNTKHPLSLLLVNLLIRKIFPL